MEVIVASSRISRVTDKGDGRALSHPIALLHIISPALEVRVIIYELPVLAKLIDGDPARYAVKELDDPAVYGREYGCARGRHNVYRVVYAALTTRARKGIDKLVRMHTGHRNYQT